MGSILDRLMALMIERMGGEGINYANASRHYGRILSMYYGITQ